MVRFYTYLEIYLDDLKKSVSLSEFERYFKVPHQTIKGYLAEFVNARILVEEKKVRFIMYTLNLENPLTKEYLILCEKERLMDALEKNRLFSRLYQTIYSAPTHAKILIFGSSITEKEFNDIDILIVGKNDKIKKQLEIFEQTYAVKLHIVETQERNLTFSFIKEIRKKHIIMKNHEYFMEVLYSER